MTERLEKAVAQIRLLPDDRQNAIADLILDEIQDEARWDEIFARSPNMLEKLAAEADREERS